MKTFLIICFLALWVGGVAVTPVDAAKKGRARSSAGKSKAKASKSSSSSKSKSSSGKSTRSARPKREKKASRNSGSKSKASGSTRSKPTGGATKTKAPRPRREPQPIRSVPKRKPKRDPSRPHRFDPAPRPVYSQPAPQPVYCDAPVVFFDYWPVFVEPEPVFVTPAVRYRDPNAGAYTMGVLAMGATVANTVLIARDSRNDFMSAGGTMIGLAAIASGAMSGEDWVVATGLLSVGVGLASFFTDDGPAIVYSTNF